MPIDPSIPLSVQPMRLRSPIESVGNFMQLRIAQQNADALEEERRARAADRELMSQKRQRDLDDESKLSAAFAGDFTRESVIGRLRTTAPHLIPDVTKIFDDVDTRALALQKAKSEAAVAEDDYFGSLAAGVEQMEYSPESLRVALAHATKAGYGERAKEFATLFEQNPDQVKPIVESLRARSKTYARKPETPQVVNPGDTLVGDKGQVLYKAPAKAPEIGTFEDFIARHAKEKGVDPNTLTTKDIEGLRERFRLDQRTPVTVNLTGEGSDAELIADAIIAGDQSPELQGLYRQGPAVRAILAKKGYNHAAALSDWRATQRYLATVSGPQQTRIRQAVDTAYHSLDVIEELANQWDAGRFPLLNRANLALAKNGALGLTAEKAEAAQAIATKLEAQITDVASELANVYMGGNSPTDHALGLAEKNLNANWGKTQLKEAIDLARKNLKIRQNAIRNVGPIGVRGDNPYAPQQQPDLNVPAPAPATAPNAPNAPPTVPAANAVAAMQKPIPGIPGAIAESKDGGKTWTRIK